MVVEPERRVRTRPAEMRTQVRYEKANSPDFVTAVPDFVIAVTPGGSGEASSIVAVRRSERLLPEFDERKMRWETELTYEVPGVIRVLGAQPKALADHVHKFVERARGHGRMSGKLDR
jgi:hypothetical protein